MPAELSGIDSQKNLFARAASSSHSTTRTILHVEDDDIERDVLARLLKKHGYLVIAAANCEQAEQLVSALHFDLAIVDIRLPDGNGMDLCRKLRQTPLNTSTPLLQMSCFDTDLEAKVAALESGADAYLPKSADERELLATISAMVRRKLSTATERQVNLGEVVAAQYVLSHGTLGLQTVMDLICERSQLLTGAEGAVIELLDGEDLIYRACSGMASPYVGFRLKSSNSLSGLCIRTRQVLRCDDSETDDRVDRASCRKLGIRSMIIVPLGPAAGSEPIGVLKCLSNKCHAFSDQHMNLVELMAGMMAAALANTMAASELKRREEELHYQANHDPLTKLANRAAFRQVLQEAMHHEGALGAEAYAVLYLDLDRFKIVNDSLGHSAGDSLLIQTATRLRDCVRPGDLVARLGGDEFAILLRNLRGEDARTDARTVAERIHRALSRPFHVKGRDLFSSVSIGIAMCSISAATPESILRDADNAMYRAKAEGTGRITVFDVHMHEHIVRQLQLEMDLRLAVERDQFVLHYQPVVSLESGAITGFEALIRWEHPTRGLLAPGEFIPIAEETRLIVEMGEWALREAASWLQKLQAECVGAAHLTVAVNISGLQFAQPDFLDLVAAVLEETTLPAHCLKLEITESTMVQRAQMTPDLMQRLRSMEVELLIDDFGTGYSSLSYLTAYPLDALKIDRSFVSKLSQPNQEQAPEVIRCICAMAGAFHMNVIAEGIETRQELSFLRKIGCGYGQGYFFSPPLPAEEARELVLQGSLYELIMG